ncbi:MAG: hypothetical protein IJA12_01675 [Oscillospiraceae bacterium]|nr:hypothetical protein [Oscillospiraceae bacterium]
MNNDNEKNINLTLVQNEEKSDSGIAISFETIFIQLKKFFSLWIILALLSGMLVTGCSIFLKETVPSDMITALVSFNYDGIKSGIAPDGKKLDVNKIKAPNIIETALTNLDESLVYVEPIRRTINIQGLISDDELDQISLYKSVYQSGGSAALEAVKRLLAMDFNSSYYIINFNNEAAGFDVETGKKIIDEILNAYQDYFFTTYGYNAALGNSIVAVDYTEYDYPAAVDIFKILLDDLDNYVSHLQQNGSADFRSSETGYSFEDIRRSIEVIRTADLESISSYITIYNVTNDKDQLITYYNYKIEELQRSADVLKTELQSISESIDAYEKDSMLIFGESAGLDETEYSQASEKYDELIEEKISVAQEYSAKQQQVEYYKLRLETFEKNEGKRGGNTEYVDEVFAKLYEKINNLIDITTKTSDEYYENIVFANAFNILVPATGDESTVQINGILIPIILVEAVLFAAYIGYAFISAIVIDVKRKKKTESMEIISEEN